MTSYERALALVYDAIDVINTQQPAAMRLRKSPDTVIVGVGGALDSLGVVNFVLTLEEKIAAGGTTLPLLDDDVMVEHSPLRTIDSVSRYIAEHLV